MDQNTQNEIIGIIEKNVEQFNACSIKEAAHKVFYFNITLHEQKKIAKLIVKKNHYTSEIKNGDVIVKQNLSHNDSGNDTEERYHFLKYVMFAIAGLLSYLVFKVFLPGLSK